ncbi:nucleoside hydrolase [Sutcliffiella cohnii]
MGKKVLFFGDFGIDDIVALIYAFFEDEIDIVGIVADYGNVPKSTALRNARYLQEISQSYEIPIIGGAERSALGTSDVFYPEIHGEEGFGGFIPPDLTNHFENDFENFHVIYDLIEQYNEDLIIVNTGRLTSLATSYILYPDTVAKVKEVYIMGGAFNFPGNVTPIAEANIFGDPYSANIVLTYGRNITIIPLNVTQSAIITPEMINFIDKQNQLKQTEIGRIIKPMLDYYYQFYKAHIPTIKGAPLHDLITLWAIINEDKMYYETRPVKVVVNIGESFGQTIGDFRQMIQLAEHPVHRIGLNYNYPAFINDVIRVLTSDVNIEEKTTF